ncbi:bifunctional RecB family nuclease/DEAD/DEAH box helicase [Nocardia callitridis]|uniref:bifunctional RecB family nuclease/DEAD/DEAH box helicase n=1 Tax=Nocardia callitridis TaxID=648753 RepID=UPI0031E798F1
MFGDRVVCSAADLLRGARCEFALLRALDTQIGTVEPHTIDAEAAPDSVLDPDRRVDALRAAHERTVAALRAGEPVIENATFFDGEFHSDCVAMVRAEHRLRYAVHGTAATRPDRLGTALELAACAASAVSAGDALIDPMAKVRFGAAITEYPMHELIPVFRVRRRRVEHILDEKIVELLPVQWGDPRYLACGRCPTCVYASSAARDLLLVAGMPTPIRARLREAGVHTIDRLAATEGPVRAIPSRTVATLRKQAEIQLRHEDSGQITYQLVDPTALGAVPTPSHGDLSLSIEGGGRAPLTIEVAGPDDTVLLSVRTTDNDHDAAREALRRVLELIARHRRDHPDAHIYHYGGAVRTALLHGTGRYGLGEELVDELLCDGALVDLYPIVRAAVLIGARSYDLDGVRRLLPDRAPRAEQECRTVLRVRDWLARRGAEHRIAPRPSNRPSGSWCAPPDADPREPLSASRPSSFEAALTEYADARDDRHPVAAVLAAALGYHRRERRPLWWAYAERLNHPVDEWSDAPGVLVADWGSVDTKWHRSPDRPTMRRYVTLTGRLGSSWNAAGSVGSASAALAPGTTVYTFYDRPPSAGMVTEVGRKATSVATVLSCSVGAEFDDVVRIEELLPDGCDPYDELPTALAPGLPEDDDNVRGAVEFAAGQLLATLPELPATAVFDILARRRPRLRDGGALPGVHGDHAAAITAALRGLDDSYVAVHGPSGTGKIRTIARVLEGMVTRHRWRIGVVAHAPSTVERILETVVGAGVLPELVAKKDAEAVAREWVVIDRSKYERFLDNAISGCVLGGMPTDFANESQVARGRLDLLVIADAGRFSLADTVAVGVSARNLLVLGDPAPAHPLGAHPEPVGASVLGWLTGARRTVPAERGYFLDRTWRMHPRVCAPVSQLYYDNRLRANEALTLARHLDDEAPGVQTVAVAHHGSTIESVDEAREVVRRVRALLGMDWTVGASTRRLHPHDIFVVAPYSAQVARIRTLLARARIEDVLVGTPDRFRGREAAVVVLSMTTSSPADAPYGMPLLLSRTLIHAALCRAMWKVIIIRSPLLTEYLPTDPAELTGLAEFLRLEASPDA